MYFVGLLLKQPMLVLVRNRFCDDSMLGWRFRQVEVDATSRKQFRQTNCIYSCLPGAFVTVLISFGCKLAMESLVIRPSRQDLYEAVQSQS